jgi:D-alanine transaminase
MIAYFNDEYKDLNDIKISPFDRGFLFADGVYESIRTYNGKLFRYEDHLNRLRKSLKEIKIEFENFNSLENIIYELIKKNEIKGETIAYLQITRGSAIPRTHHFPTEQTSPTLFISVNELVENIEERENGVKVIFQEDIRWLRCDIKSTSLLPVVLANQKAKEENAVEAIFVRDGLITEGTHTNFFAVKDETVYTAPKSKMILEGITRKLVLEFCQKFKVDYREEFINKNDLKSFNEFFITSTTKEITPVTTIDYWTINQGEPGKITKSLQTVFKKVAGDY